MSINHFKNRHLGQTCIIIGNGPSLKFVPRPFIDMYPNFGQNKCYLNKPPLVDFTPSYYVTSDPDHDIDYDAVMQYTCPKFLKEGLLKHGGEFVHEFKLTREHVFSKHPDVCLYEGYSVTFISLQLAYYMGFHTVLLIGVDHRYLPYNPETELDPNHYTPEYEGKTDFNPKSLAKGEKYILESMLLAKIAFENDNKRVINLTPNSNLKVFPFDSVENWM